MSVTPAPSEGVPGTKGNARAPRPRALLALGATLTVLGLAIAATAPVLGTSGSERSSMQDLSGGIALLVGWAFLAWGIHRVGRAG